MNPRVKALLKALSNLPVVIVVIFALLLHGPQLFGIRTYCVLSGSMGKAHPTGALIYVAPTDPAKLQPKDVITYQRPGAPLTTHRIVELVPDENDPSVIRFRTKGDANEEPDGPLVEYSHVVGKVLFSIPGLGRLANDISVPPGKYIAIAVAAAMVLLEIVIGIVLDDSKNKVPTQENNQNEKETQS